MLNKSFTEMMKYDLRINDHCFVLLVGEDVSDVKHLKLKPHTHLSGMESMK